MTGVAMTKESQTAARKAMGFFHLHAGLRLCRLLVGAFMIFNTFTITVAQRTREYGLLRALGASRRQILSSVLLEALAVGLVASILGVIGGLGVAIGLKALLSAVGIPIPADTVVVKASTVVISMTVGVGVALLAAVSPARKAAEVPPIAAMQRGLVGSTGSAPSGGSTPGRGSCSWVSRLCSSASSARWAKGSRWWVRGPCSCSSECRFSGAPISRPLSRFLGAPLPRLRGVTGELARDNAMRNPKRTAASASVLMIGVGLVGSSPSSCPRPRRRWSTQSTSRSSVTSSSPPAVA